jgi:hypothetical protein
MITKSVRNANKASRASKWAGSNGISPEPGAFGIVTGELKRNAAKCGILKILEDLERIFLTDIGRSLRFRFGICDDRDWIPERRLKVQAVSDDQHHMIDRILYIASLAFRAIQHLAEQPEQRRQYNRLARGQEFVPAPVRGRQSVRIVGSSRG